MRRLGIALAFSLAHVAALAVAGCSSGHEEWPGRAGRGAPLTLTWTAPAVGLVQTTTELSTQDVTLQVSGQPPERVRLERRVEKRTEVLEVRDTFKHKLAVRYERARESQADDRETVARDLPVAGKSYVVWRDLDGIAATTAGGAAVGADELAALRDDLEPELGRVPGMARLVLGRSWLRGETIILGSDQRAAVAADLGPGTQVSALTAIWTGTDEGVATFDLAIDATGDQGVKMPMQATVRIDVDRARPIEVAGTAALSGRADGGTLAGTLSTRVVNTYDDPARPPPR